MSCRDCDKRALPGSVYCLDCFNIATFHHVNSDWPEILESNRKFLRQLLKNEYGVALQGESVQDLSLLQRLVNDGVLSEKEILIPAVILGDCVARDQQGRWTLNIEYSRQPLVVFDSKIGGYSPFLMAEESSPNVDWCALYEDAIERVKRLPPL